MTLGVLAAAAASSVASNDVEPGVLGFLVVAGMGVALVFLLRSMNKQFRKITPEPGAPDGEADGEEAKDPGRDAGVATRLRQASGRVRPRARRDLPPGRAGPLLHRRPADSAWSSE